MREYLAVDSLMNMPKTPEQARKDQETADPSMAAWFKNSKVMWEGATFEEMVAEMDDAGIEMGIVTASADQAGRGPYSVGTNVDDEAFEAVCERFVEARNVSKGRLFGCIGIDPTLIMTSVRRLERAVREYDFNHAWIMPSMIGLPPNHAVYFPIYAKCVELSIPIKINCGMPGPMRFAKTQRPVDLDEVCLAFPELTVVACHVGHPWHLESVAMLQKHPNFYLATSGFAPKHVPSELWDVANKRFPNKLIFATDYPLLPMARCVSEAWDLPLKDAVRRQYLRENAIDVFKLC